MKKNSKKIKNDLVIYQAKSGAIGFRGDFSRETIWATLDQIADVFGRDKSVISRHLKSIYKEKELDKNATVAKNATVQIEGSRTVERIIEYYNLLYFMVKNHPFIDGNKRSGAFAFIWFLRRNGVKGARNINPAGLTAITLLIAESDPKHKDKMVALITQLLK